MEIHILSVWHLLLQKGDEWKGQSVFNWFSHSTVFEEPAPIA